MAAKRRPGPRGTVPPPVLESPLDAFKIGADVRAMQAEVRDNNARYAKTNAHIIMASAAWHAYRQHRTSR
jgi:hypothetical protein